ncbi:MAG: caspase family protein [Leptospirillia bacterium]
MARPRLFAPTFFFLPLLFFALFFPEGPPARGESVGSERLATLVSSARSGNPSALNALGSLYYDGRGVFKDRVRARRFYLRSAEKGSLKGARNLGWMLWKGEGGPADPAGARKWLQTSARGGDLRAMNMLGAFFLSKAGGADAKRAFESFRRGARAGDREAMYNLGALYDRGAGVGVDYAKAAHWWKKAARAGDTTAQTALGDLYERGQGVPKDYGQATALYRKAAAGGNPLGRESLETGPWVGTVAPLSPRNFADSRRPSREVVRPSVPAPAADLPALPRSGGIVPAASTSPVLPVAGRAEAGGPSDEATRRDLALLTHEVATLVQARKKSSGPHFATTVDRPDYREPENPDAYAVVVGVESYPGGVPSALFAGRDARAVMRHFEALGVPADHIRLLTDALGTRGGIDAALHWLSRNATRRSTVYFYYSGHGLPGQRGEPFLAPSGVMATDLDDTAYPVSRLYKHLAAVGASRTLVILDACFAGSGPRSFGTELRPVYVESTVRPEEGLVVLSAVSGSQESGVIEAKGHGLFTYYLLKGLNGAAARKDHVTLDGLFDYAREHVASRAHLDDRNQVPSLVLGRPGMDRLRLR